MLTTVACATGRDLFTLLDTPLWQLLYTYQHLTARDARRALHDRLSRVDQGMLNARAFNAPATLTDELTAVREEIAALDRPRPTAPELAALRTAGLSLLDRVRQGRVLAPEALVS